MKRLIIVIFIFLILTIALSATESNNILNLDKNDFYWEIENDQINVYRYEGNKIFVSSLDEQFNKISEQEFYSFDEEIKFVRHERNKKIGSFFVFFNDSYTILDIFNQEIRIFTFPLTTITYFGDGENIIFTDRENKQISLYDTNLQKTTKTIDIERGFLIEGSYIYLLRRQGFFKRFLDIYDTNLNLIQTLNSKEFPELRKINFLGLDKLTLNLTVIEDEKNLSINIQPKFRSLWLFFLSNHNYILNFSINEELQLRSKYHYKSSIFNFNYTTALNIIDNKIFYFQFSSKNGSGFLVFDNNTAETKNIMNKETYISAYLSHNGILALVDLEEIIFYKLNTDTLEKEKISSFEFGEHRVSKLLQNNNITLIEISELYSSSKMILSF